MRFTETPISGVVVVELEPHADQRGFFARSHSISEFGARGLLEIPVESSISSNPKTLTLRGMHYQADPNPDPKLVRCTRGELFDVAVDLRSDSPTFREWFGIRLHAADHKALHIPGGCAHGFLTLADNTDVFYMIGAKYESELARGVRWNDQAFAIHWPTEPLHISDRDSTYPNFMGLDQDIS